MFISYLKYSFNPFFKASLINPFLSFNIKLSSLFLDTKASLAPPKELNLKNIFNTSLN